jgi:hypothetical protein
LVESGKGGTAGTALFEKATAHLHERIEDQAENLAGMAMTA